MDWNVNGVLLQALQDSLAGRWGEATAQVANATSARNVQLNNVRSSGTIP